MMSDTYAEFCKLRDQRRHGEEAPEYSEKRAFGLAVAHRDFHPVAWVFYEENGNPRIWWSDYEAACSWARHNDLDQSELEPLFASGAFSHAALDVLAERRRQVEVKGWDHEHDDAHPCGEIAAFAAVYAMPDGARDWPATETGYGDTFADALTPHDWQPKFGDRRRDLVKAAALLIAEIERIDRAASAKKASAAA